MIALLLTLFASSVLAQGTLPTTRVFTCGFFYDSKGGSDVRFCGTSCSNPTAPAATVPFCPPMSGEPIDTQVRWGKSATSGNPYAQSGMGFTGVDGKEVPLNREWFCGKLTHFNHPIIGPARAVSLQLQLRIPEFDVNKGFSFTLQIDETTNSQANGPCPYPSTVPCSDKITFDLGGLDFDTNFEIGKVKYTLQLTGFKESRVSTSFPTEAFISNEKRENNAFLFARVVAACPAECGTGGKPTLVVQNGKKTCACDCQGKTCDLPQELAKDCSCQCPVGTCNGAPTKPGTCDCDCPTASSAGLTCTSPKSGWDAAKCACKCDDNLCGAGALVDEAACKCDCAQVTCPNGRVPNPLKQCECECLAQCGPTQKKVEDAGKCECQCDPAKTQCAEGFKLEIDPTDPSKCRCGCANICGTGCGKAGGTKQCNEGPSNPCCQECQYKPVSCDDNDNCTKNDKCDVVASIMAQKSVCKGEPACPTAPDVCTFYNCDPATGNCNKGQLMDGAACGPTGSSPATWNLCENWCQEGRCVSRTVDCDNERAMMGITASEDPASCEGFSCNPKTGACEAGPKPGKACNDGNLCTTNDVCTETGGAVVCQGVLNDCSNEPPQQCHAYQCSPLIGECVAVPVPYGNECGGDGTDACKTDGICSGGVCLFKKKCPKLTDEQAQCNTNVCNSASGACDIIPRPDGSACILANGRPRGEDFCGGNYTCVGGICDGDIREENKNHSECGGMVIIESGDGQRAEQAAIIGGVAAALIMVIVAVLLCAFVNKTQLIDPNSWGMGSDAAVTNSPLYDQSAGGTNNALYEG